MTELAASQSARLSTNAIAASRFCVLLALAASAALYRQYLNPLEANFCGLESGCEAIRRSGLSYFLGTPLVSTPLFGLLGFAVAFALLLNRPGAIVTRAVLGLGAVIAAVLVGVQAFVLHAFCWLCVTVDVFAILAFATSWVAMRDASPGGPAPEEPFRKGAWVFLGVLAVGAPALWVEVKGSAPVPPGVAALYEPGKANVVEFADFECPYCRRLHPVLRQVVSSFPANKVHFVRRHVPLEMHPRARPAARAALCAEAQGKGDAVADRLVEGELSDAEIRDAVRAGGVDLSQFDRCLSGSEVDTRIAADEALFDAAHMPGLPSTFVGKKRLVGVVSEAALRSAIEDAMEGDEFGGVPGALYIPLVLFLAVGALWLGRISRVTLHHERSV